MMQVEAPVYRRSGGMSILQVVGSIVHYVANRTTLHYYACSRNRKNPLIKIITLEARLVSRSDSKKAILYVAHSTLLLATLVGR